MSFFSFLFGRRKRKAAKISSSRAMRNVVRTAKKVSSKNIQQGIIDANVLNIRDKADKNGEIVGKLSRGTIIAVTNKTNNGWYEFQYNGKTAFAFGKFVKFITGEISANVLNFRDKPSKNSNVIGKLNRGDKVEVLYKLTNWLQIKVKGKIGYVSSKFVNFNNSSSSSKSRTDKYKENKIPPTGDFLKDKKFLLESDLEAKHKIKLPAGVSRNAKLTANIYNNFGALIKLLSQEIDIDMATAISVIAVESGGRGFGKSGKPLIRFENHLFYRFWGASNSSVYNKHFKYSSGKRWTGHMFRKKRTDDWTSFHGNQTKEWEVLEFARTLNNNAAFM